MGSKIHLNVSQMSMAKGMEIGFLNRLSLIPLLIRMDLNWVPK